MRNDLDTRRDAGIEKSSIPELRTCIQIISYTLPVATRCKQKRCEPVLILHTCSIILHAYCIHVASACHIQCMLHSHDMHVNMHVFHNMLPV